MRSTRFFLPLLLILALAVPAQAQIYVDDDATGAGDGTSWADAFPSLQDALAAATSGDEIWVAAGVYYPDDGAAQTADDPSSTFALINQVHVYGGFFGTSVLSGDLAQDDTNVDGNHIAETTADIQGSNAYNVVTGNGTTGSATLDGFTITAGQANGTTANQKGGAGMRTNNGDPTLRNLVFIGNAASGNGGGMANANGSSPSVTNVSFVANTAVTGGGGMNNFGSSNPTLTNVTFSGNVSDNVGGGINNNGSYPNLLFVTFTGNEADNFGGAMSNIVGSTPTIVNAIAWGNTGGDVINEAGSSYNMQYSVVEGGCSTSGGSCVGVVTTDPLLGPLADHGGAVPTHAIGAGSPAIGAASGPCPDTDARGFARGAICDIGAFEFSAVAPMPTVAVTPLDSRGGDPVGAPVAIPSGGQKVFYRATATNTSGAVFSTEVWPSIELPSGTVITRRRSVDLGVPTDDTGARDSGVNLNGGLPSGTYTLTVYIGTHPGGALAQASFDIEKAAARWGEPTLSEREIAAMDFDALFGDEDTASVETAPDGVERPTATVLGQGYPNPFNPTATVPFTLARDGEIRLAVYDLLGREVAVLAQGRMSAGSHTAVFDAGLLSSGTYLVRFSAPDGQIQTQRLTLLK